MSKKSIRPNSLKSALKFGVGMGAMFAAFAAPTHAQEAEEAPEEARKLQTITVTATKREQTLQDVPVAVSVVGEEVIDQAEIIDLNDLQSLVPSLRVGQLQSSANTNFIIRGFGNGANNVGIEPSVGVFIDGVYRSRSAAQISDLPNIQRVEVLRGPQSTLFGKNASAGVISIVTEEAQFEWGGGLEATAGNFNTYRLKGDVTGPLSENVAFSLAANYNSRDGYAEDIARGSETNERNRYGFRGQLQFEPSEALSFRLIADYDQIDEVCCVAANLVNGPTGAVTNALGGINAEDPFSYEVFGNFDSENDITNSGVSLQGDYEMDFATLTSITAFRKVESQTNADSDFTGADLIGNNNLNVNIDTFTQEIRLTSNSADSQIDWMVGAFYFDEEVEADGGLQYGADYRAYADALSGGGFATVEGLLGLPVGATFGQAGQGRFAEYGQDNQAWSLFGTLDFHATDRLTATVGINFTSDEKDAFYNEVSTDAFSALDFVAIGNQVLFQTAFAQTYAGFGVDATDQAAIAAFEAVAPGTLAAVTAGSQAFADANHLDPNVNPLLALQPLQFIPPFLSYPNAVEDGKSSDEETTYTLRLAYDINDNFNVYASYATGFKATSWNLSTDSRPFSSDFIAGSPVTNPASSAIRDAGLALPNLTAGTRYAGPENSTVYEIGVKAAFDTWAFNLTLFDQTIEGFQSNAFTGTGFNLANAGEQSVQGLEIDTSIQVTDNFNITAAATLLDPVYDSFTGSITGDISGTTPSGIPEISSSIAGTYNFELNDNWSGYVRGDWQHVGDTEFFDDAANNPTSILLSQTDFSREIDTLNGSIGFESADGLAVSIWGRNMLDNQYISTAFPSVAQAGSVSGYPSQPATWGVTLSKEW